MLRNELLDWKIIARGARMNVTMEVKPPPESIGRVVTARPLKNLAQTLAQTRAATASGLWGSSVAAVVAALEKELRRPILVICGHLDEADDMADDIELFAGRRPDVLPALELGG